MLKRYFKLTYYSIIFAVFIALFSSASELVHISGSPFTFTLLTLVVIQISIYIYTDLKYIIPILKNSIKIAVYIPLNYVKCVYKLKSNTVLYKRFNLYQLNVIRC